MAVVSLCDAGHGSAQNQRPAAVSSPLFARLYHVAKSESLVSISAIILYILQYRSVLPWFFRFDG